MSIKFTLDGIAHLLADRTLEVPVYQRSYAWGEEEVSDYWTDLRRALDEGFDEYFMGTIVTAAQNGSWTVIDGQQRLATTTIVLAALRDIYQSRQDPDRAEGINDQYLARFDIGSAETVPRLRLNAEDREFFLAAIVEGVAPETRIPSHVRLREAQALLHRRMEEDLGGAGDDWQARALAWVKLLHAQVKVMVIDVSDIADGYVIFETLNDRGAPLTASDLIRNYLMSQAEDETGIDVVQQAWIDSLLQLGLQEEDSVFVDFLRQFWSSHHGAVREKDLYEAIRNELDDRAKTLEFAESLPYAARYYAALLDPQHELWTGSFEALQTSISALNRLALKQYRPLALALLDEFHNTQLVSTFRALVSWTVRGLVVGGIGGGVAERAYGTAATRVRSGELADVDSILRQLIPIVPSDADFLATFSRARIPRVSVARYVMTSIERGLREHANPQLVDDEFGTGLRLEYVLPKSASAEGWEAFEEESIKTLVPRIGNLVLLSEEDSDISGLDTFAERRAVLAESSVASTREVADFETWDEDAIDVRQRRLAEMAVEVWPRLSE